MLKYYHNLIGVIMKTEIECALFLTEFGKYEFSRLPWCDVNQLVKDKLQIDTIIVNLISLDDVLSILNCHFSTDLYSLHDIDDTDELFNVIDFLYGWIKECKFYVVEHDSKVVFVRI